MRIATLNIRWFGLGGSFWGSFGSETREETISAFIQEQLEDHNVVVFQEIVDLELFGAAVMSDRTCIHYEPIGGKHQHVVLCHDDTVHLEPTVGDDDFTLEALRMGSLRPAVHGTLVAGDGDPVAAIVGVHLKAHADSTARRLEQAAVLGEYVAELRTHTSLPVLIIGDFNTHRAVDTGLDDDDELLIDEALEPWVARVPLPAPNTYRHHNGTAYRLDQAYVSDNVEVRDVQILGPCNLDLETGADQIAAHYAEVSDHCAVSLQVWLP